LHQRVQLAFISRWIK